MHKEKFMIYRRDAKKGEATYSPKSHSTPHFVGHFVEGMEEWASWYCFNKKEDGTYEAELDEAWDEGSHYGGGPSTWIFPRSGSIFHTMTSSNMSSPLLQLRIMVLQLMT